MIWGFYNRAYFELLLIRERFLRSKQDQESKEELIIDFLVDYIEHFFNFECYSYSDVLRTGSDFLECVEADIVTIFQYLLCLKKMFEGSDYYVDKVVKDYEWRINYELIEKSLSEIDRLLEEYEVFKND